MYRERQLSAPLDCDQVFDVLTSFRCSETDDCRSEVERHLATCRECRELAESLGPAVELFHEAIWQVESDSRPLVSPARLEAAATAARGATPDSWQIVAVFASGVLLAMLFLGVAGHGAQFPLSAPNSLTSTEARQASFQPTEMGREWLATVGLRAVCFPTPENSAEREHVHRHGSAKGEAAYACCLSCHAASSANRPPLDAQAMLDRACHACHNY